MRILNESRTTEFPLARGARCEVTERVRGIDARAGTGGFLFASHTPASMTLYRDGEMRQISLAAAPRPSVAAFALPALYLATRLLLRNRRKR